MNNGGLLICIGLCLLVVNCSADSTTSVDDHLAEVKEAIFHQPLHPVEEKRQFTAKQLTLQFKLLKQAFNDPANPELSDEVIQNLEPLSKNADEPICLEKLDNLQSASDVLRHTLIHELERSFEGNMKRIDQQYWENMINFYVASVDAVKHWSISNDTLIEITKAYRQLEDENFSKAEDFKAALMATLNKELLADEEAFKRGEISKFLTNSEIVQEAE